MIPQISREQEQVEQSVYQMRPLSERLQTYQQGNMSRNTSQNNQLKGINRVDNAYHLNHPEYLNQQQLVTQIQQNNPPNQPNLRLVTPEYPQQLVNPYRQALKFGGLPQNSIQWRAVEIPQFKIPNKPQGMSYIHQLNVVKPHHLNGSKQPHIVMLHGFGGTSLNFVKFLNPLSEHFQVHALDAIGVGMSGEGGWGGLEDYIQSIINQADGRGNQPNGGVEPQRLTPQSLATQYFVSALQSWRIAIGLTQPFILMGHSFGGYQASAYFKKYPENISKLILLSPAGTTKRSTEEYEAMVANRFSASCKSKMFYFIGKRVYGYKIRPSASMRFPILGKKISKMVIADRLKIDNEAEKEAWGSYLLKSSEWMANMRSSQTSFYHIFKWPIFTQLSVQQIVSTYFDSHGGLGHEIPSDNQGSLRQQPPQQSKHIKIDFYFGITDWMDSQGAKRLKDKYENVTLVIVPSSGHQIVFDNPAWVTASIIERNVLQ